MQHKIFMNRAVELAEKGRYRTAPNPCVGAVLVYKNTVVAEGYHKEYGREHAEVSCLCDALEKGIFYPQIQAGSLKFSNPILQKKLEENAGVRYAEKIDISECALYVTLEPCNHFGKTPPCSLAVYEAGIKEIYIGMPDLNPKAGGGAQFLREKGVAVHMGICEKECAELIEDFLVWQKEKRPYCILKMACTLDGKIGPAKGHSHIVSGKESKQKTMQFRKNIALAGGAVMVGSNTFFEDNPKLTVRDLETDVQPKAFIVSSRLPEIKDGKTGYFCLDERKDTVLFTGSSHHEQTAALEQLGISVELTEKDIDGKINLKKVFEKAFQKYHCPYIFCEGGPKLAQALLKEGLADELVLYAAPVVLGDETAKSVFSGHSVNTMQEGFQLKITKTEMAGRDLHIYLKPEKECLQD